MPTLTIVAAATLAPVALSWWGWSAARARRARRALRGLARARLGLGRGR
jgi:hypothetical protein